MMGRTPDNATADGLGARVAPAVTTRTVVAVAWVVAALLLAGPLTSDVAVANAAITTAIFGILVIGYDLIVGLAGQFSFGNGGLFALGAYSAGLASHHGWPVPAGLAMAVLSGLIGAIIVGVPSLRLTGFYFAIITLSFAVLISTLLLGWVSVTGGATGLGGIEAIGSAAGEPTNYRLWFRMSWIACGLALRDRGGAEPLEVRACLASDRARRERCWVSGDRRLSDEAPRLRDFGLYAGVAGFFFAHYIRYLAPSEFGVALAVEILLMLALGGQGSIWGPILGVAVLRFFPILAGDLEDTKTVAYGATLVIVLAIAPLGLAGAIRQCYKFVSRRGRRRALAT